MTRLQVFVVAGFAAVSALGAQDARLKPEHSSSECMNMTGSDTVPTALTRVPRNSTISPFVQCWYSEQLRAMEEPSLFSLSVAATDTIVRLTWLRTFHHGISVRVARGRDRISVAAVELDGAGGYAPGKPHRREGGEGVHHQDSIELAPGSECGHVSSNARYKADRPGIGATTSERNPMGSFDAVISALYTNFLLRDFAAKIVPGSILLLALPIYHASFANVVAAVEQARWFEVAAFLSAAWTVSYAVQTLGEQRGLIHQWPTDREAYVNRYQTRVLFSRFASDRERRLVERYVVTKEASATAFLVLILIAVLVGSQLLVDVAITPWSGVTFGRSLVPVAATIIMGYYLRISHEKHLKRQYAEIDAVISLGRHDAPMSPEAVAILDATRQEIAQRANRERVPVPLSNREHR
jgi:hypothetical protein